MMDNYSLSDIKAVTDGNESGFGGGAWWIIVLFLFMFRGGNGFDGNGATAATQHEILLGQQFETIGNKLNSIGDGLCNGFYSLNNSVMGEGRAIQNAIREEGAATRSLIQTNEIQSLRDKVTDLQMQQSQCAQNAYLVNALRPCPVPAYITCSPYQTYGNGCSGCGSYQPNI